MAAEILINEAYGRFRLSKKALAIYNAKLRELYPTHVDIKDVSSHAHRMNPILIDIVRQLGDAANGKFSKITIEKFNPDVKEYITISEYDGYETIECNYGLYKLDLIRAALNSDTLLDCEKIARIRNILEMSEYSS